MDSNHRSATVKVSCLTAWRYPYKNEATTFIEERRKNNEIQNTVRKEERTVRNVIVVIASVVYINKLIYQN